jgi:cation diffusion facilitator CzcD-associated flavoprotein CzcO
MTGSNMSDRYCVIGAGPCGLTAAKNLLQQGIACDLLERENDLGGNWNIANRNSSVYASTHLISSKSLTEFVDFPMPRHFPHYPNHRQVLEYLRSYAEHFQLERCLQLGTTVDRAEPATVGWQVQVAGESQPRSYAGLIVANGHHWDPFLPQFPGTFTGRILHAHDYKSCAQLHQQRVLVIGAGNSGCDIAAEAGDHAAATFLSLRRGYHFLPKFVRGLPIDLRGERLHAWGLPLWLRRWIGALTIRLTTGTPEQYGLPRPDHRLFETHPIVNSQLLYQLGHGKISVKPNVQELAGTEVVFSDGSRETVDLLIYATGYKLSFPFLDASWIVAPSGELKLYLNAFHPQRDDLFVAGLIQPDSGIWGLADLQCRLTAKYLRALREAPASVSWFQKLKAQGHAPLGNGVRYIDSPRHLLEVEYYGYRQQLRKLLHRFGDRC